MLHNFDRLILHYFLQLIFRLTPLTSAAKNSRSKIMQHCSYLGHPLVLSKTSLWQMKSGLNFLADYQLIITSQRLRKVTSDLNQDLLFHSLPILNASTNVQCTLLSLLRIPIFCHFGSTSFVLPIRPKDSILNRDRRVFTINCFDSKFGIVRYV